VEVAVPGQEGADVPAQKSSVGPFVLGRISKAKLPQYFLGEAELLWSYFHKGKSPDHPALLLVLLDELPLLELHHFDVGIQVLKQRLHFGLEEDRAQPVGELLLSQTAKIEELMGLDVPFEVLRTLYSLRPYLELNWLNDSFKFPEHFDDLLIVHGNGELFGVV
jgi:hypothetical protein